MPASSTDSIRLIQRIVLRVECYFTHKRIGLDILPAARVLNHLLRNKREQIKSFREFLGTACDGLLDTFECECVDGTMCEDRASELLNP